MRPVAPRPPHPASSLSSSVSSGSSESYCRERERSPRTPLPPPASLHAPGPVHPIPRTQMSDARRYHSLFTRRRVAPPTPPYPSPPPSDEEPSEGTVDPAAELEGDPEEPYLEDVVYPAGYEAYSSDASYGSERESVSAGSAPSSRHSSDDSLGSGSIGYGEASRGSASDYASDDDLACKFWNFRVRFLVTSSAVCVIMTYRKSRCYNNSRENAYLGTNNARQFDRTHSREKGKALMIQDSANVSHMNFDLNKEPRFEDDMSERLKRDSEKFLALYFSTGKTDTPDDKW
ncbi:hypothetical protein PIB30_014778 [Stylosanthes scabra]|uniref:Uncharacterized protein n=1 Tax=Stylosanthes scabra TaxID=79078 RepID=A0ABU6Z559_9FABA|nr:hypothetical protein [Stylosanthes scabra]